MTNRKTSRQGQMRSTAAARESTQRHIDELLDEALTETFPASDPVSIDLDAGPRPEHRAGRSAPKR